MKEEASNENGATVRRRYSRLQVARMAGLSEWDLARCLKSALFRRVGKGSGGRRFSYQELALLRRIRIISDSLDLAKVIGALEELAKKLPRGLDLSSLPISVVGGQVVVRDAHGVWNSRGQKVFECRDEETGPAEIVQMRPRRAAEGGDAADPESLYRQGCRLENVDAVQARRAYREAVRLDPLHADALINLGRMLHEARRLAEAATHYARALELRPDDATAAFNLGVVLEDRGDYSQAIDAYHLALENDASFSDAHFNLSRLHEKLGRRPEAIQHLFRYRQMRVGAKRFVR